jgi:hypothetical protein
MSQTTTDAPSTEQQKAPLRDKVRKFLKATETDEKTYQVDPREIKSHDAAVHN